MKYRLSRFRIWRGRFLESRQVVFVSFFPFVLFYLVFITASFKNINICELETNEAIIYAQRRKEII